MDSTNFFGFHPILIALNVSEAVPYSSYAVFPIMDEGATEKTDYRTANEISLTLRAALVKKLRVVTPKEAAIKAWLDTFRTTVEDESSPCKDPWRLAHDEGGLPLARVEGDGWVLLALQSDTGRLSGCHLLGSLATEQAEPLGAPGADLESWP